MSVEIVLYPPRTSKRTLRAFLLGEGFTRSEHLWPWAKGSSHLFWFEEKDFQSASGVEATVFSTSEEQRKDYKAGNWALHTRISGLYSAFDLEKQNHVIREARRRFGGQFVNDWYGKNRLSPVFREDRGPAGRGIARSYELVRTRLGAVRFALPEPHIPSTKDGKKTPLGGFDPTRVLYNALVPYTVAALEHFLGQTFRILLRYDAKAQERLSSQTKRVEMQDLVSVARGKRSIEDVVADWYSFQNLASIQAAYKEWFGIDIRSLLRRKVKIGSAAEHLDARFDRLIQFRHGVIHRFEFDPDLSLEEMDSILTVPIVLIDALVDHLERGRGILIRERWDHSAAKRRKRSRRQPPARTRSSQAD